MPIPTLPPQAPSAAEVAESIGEHAHFALEDRFRGTKCGDGVAVITPNPALKFEVVRIADEYGLPSSEVARIVKDLIHMALARESKVCACEILEDLDLLIVKPDEE